MNKLSDFLKDSTVKTQETVKFDVKTVRVAEIQQNLGKACKNIIKTKKRLRELSKAFRKKIINKHEFFSKKGKFKARLQQQDTSIARMIQHLHRIEPRLAKPIQL